MASPDSKEKLVALIGLLHEGQIPYKMIGGMTNLLFKSTIYKGVVIKTDKIQGKNLAEDKITISCGARMGSVIRSIARIGLGGMEGLAGIPGTVGGMVRQNAGAFGYEVADRFVSAECYVPRDQRYVIFSRADMRFAYRSSALADSGSVLLSATFEPLRESPELILKSIKEIDGKRRRAQPLEYPSLGSTFKRCNGRSAGFYIDRAGLKGMRIGGAEVSRKHAGFIINIGGATANDFLKLIDVVKGKVYADFGIELEEEIEVI